MLHGGETQRVLIVDDDDDIRHVLRLLFEFEGFDIAGEARNGVEAVTIALRERPDFVILDYLMPRLDGEGTAELLRSVVPEARIVAFSAMLREPPDWADAFLNKERISEIVPILRGLIPVSAAGR